MSLSISKKRSRDRSAQRVDDKPTQKEAGEPLLISGEKTSRLLGISLGTLYNMMARGEVKSLTIGRRRLFPISEVHRILSRAH